MNREIKFRGISKEIKKSERNRKGTKEWVYGSLIVLTTGYYIVPTDTYYNEIDVDLGQKMTINALWENNDFYKVIPETVGQYTGLYAQSSYRGTNKENLEIYEHDLLTVCGKFYVVTFQDGMFGVILSNGKIESLKWFIYENKKANNNLKIFSSIHDKELED